MQVDLARRKSAHQLRVELFMHKYREMGNLGPLPSRPTVPDGKMIIAQARVVLEEFLEVIEACGLELFARDDQGYDVRVVRGQATLQPAAGAEVYLPEVAKELADLSVVTTGMFAEFGIADLPVLEEVDHNNLAKFGPGCRLDENRKLHKPPHHTKPDIKSNLIQQGWNPEGTHEADVQDPSVSHRSDKQTRKEVASLG